eukprot:8928662-Ditylum_brightwellii.AAC.1
MERIHKAKEVVAKESGFLTWALIFVIPETLSTFILYNIFFILLAFSLSHVSTRALVECFCLAIEYLTLCTCKSSFLSVSRRIPNSWSVSSRQ